MNIFTFTTQTNMTFIMPWNRPEDAAARTAFRAYLNNQMSDEIFNAPLPWNRPEDAAARAAFRAYLDNQMDTTADHVLWPSVNYYTLMASSAATEHMTEDEIYENYWATR
jgi:hypothetical protein